MMTQTADNLIPHQRAGVRRCPDCGVVFLVHAGRWDCACCWLCHHCIEARKDRLRRRARAWVAC